MTCGVFFTRCCDGAFVACDLPDGHNCAHSWKDPALTKWQPSITHKPAARKTKGKRRAARKEAPVSPMSEQIKIPDGYRIERQPTCQPQAEMPIAVRDRDGRVLAQIDVWRPSGALN